VDVHGLSPSFCFSIDNLNLSNQEAKSRSFSTIFAIGTKADRWLVSTEQAELPNTAERGIFAA
jgi:hypothetical protein